MCDCFNLGFPNWHGSLGTGSGRRLKGPEPATVDDSICEEPSEFIEGERPRPQGSSPVDEYPETDKYKDSDKQGGGGSGKKGKRGFGSLFEKRSPAKMSQLESPESGVIVKMAKETCAEGLVVSGGKEGIFIKEVRPESPASKLLSVHEGDQILSATVYFDNVTYEDALQILEHAQPYKMELLLKRKPIKTSTLESEPALEIIQVEEGSSLEMRGHSKTKRHGDRISWPKFPSFSKSQKSHFKRSHSTSEADDKRKLELSPTTSDTESPIKSQEAVKGKTKKHKIKLSSMKMKGRKSMSVEQPNQDTDILTVEHVEGMENQQSQDDIHSPDGLESASVDTSQVYVLESESEKIESTKIRNECILPDLAGSETKQHKVELISLDKTLKITDITVALADQESPSTKKSPEGKKKKKENKERSELKFTFKGNEKKDKHKQNIPVKVSLKSLKTPREDMITSDLSAHDNTLLSPTVVSHTELEECQLPIDINTQVIINESSGKALPSTDMEMSMPKVDICLDMSDIGLIRKSPQIGQEQHLKETYVKTDVNAQEISIHAKVISITMEPDSQMEIQASKLPTERSIDDVLAQIGTRSAPKFKLQRVDPADFVTDKPIKMTDVKIVEMDVKGLTVEDKGLKILPSREDIEIPGIEDASLTSTKAPVIKQPKTAFTLPVEEIQAQTVQMVIDVDRVKEAVSKLPGFKLPKGDIAGLPAHQQITMTDVNAKRVDATLSKITDIKAQLDTYVKKTDINALPEKLSRSSVTTFKLPKTQLFDLGAHEPITMTEIDHTKTKQEAGKTNEDEIQIELHKRENVEKAGMETIQQKGTPNKVEKEKETGEILEPKFAVPVPEGPTIPFEERNRIPATYTKGLDKKSKKANISMPRFGITQTDIRFPDIGIGLPKRHTSVEKKDEVKDESNALHLEMKMSEAEIKLSKVPDSEYSTIKTQTPTIRTLSSETMPEVPSSDIKGAVMGIDVQSVDVEVPSVEVEIPETVYKDIDVKMKKRQMSFPKFGVKAPEIDVSVLKPDISLPEGNMEVKLPEVEIEVPELQVEVKDTVGSPSRFKIPTLKFPKFGAVSPIVTVELPDGTERPEPKLSILGKVHAVDFEKQSDLKKSSVKIPSIDVDVKTKGLELEGQGSKFKLPNQGMSLPKVKCPEIDLGVSKKDIDVTLPETNVEIQPPDVELKVSSGEVEMPEQAATEIDVKVKKPRISFPGLGFSKPEVCEVDVSLPKVDISLPEGNVGVKKSEVEMTAPEIQVEVKHDIELEGQGSKFKLPKFGISMPKVKGPEIDLSLSKKVIDVTLPEDKVEVQPHDVEIEMPSGQVQMPEGAATEIDVKMKKPRMSFGWFSKPEVKAPEVDVSLLKVGISLPEGKVEFKEPEVEFKAPESQVEVKHDIELHGQGSMFKLPTSVISLPKVKGPEIDLSWSKTDVDVELPDVEVKVPSFDVEIPEVVSKDIDVKMKKTQMSFPKFGFTEVKAPALDVSLPKVDISLPEGKVEVKELEVEIKAPEIQVEMKHGIELQGQRSKFKLPKLGVSLPKVKSSEIDLSVSKADVDVNLPERRAALQLPDVEVGVSSVKVEKPEAVSKDIDMKMKMPRMSFPKFGFSKPEVKAPEVDVSLPEVDISLPEEKVEVKEPEVEIEAPEIQAEVKDTVGSPSRFKMPTLKFPQFGAAAPNITVEVPDVDKDIKVHGSEIPELRLTMSTINIEKPSVDLKGPSIDLDVKNKRLDIVTLPEASVEVQPPTTELKVPSGEVEMPEGDATEIDVKMKKPRMSFGWFSKPEVKAPEVDVSLPKGDNSLPEVKVEVKESEVEIKAPEIQVEMKHGIELEGQGSKFKLPKFGISLPKVKGPEFDLSISKTDVDVNLPERRADQLPDVEVGVPSVEVEIPEAVSKDIDVKMKKPRMSFPKFGFSKPEVKVPEVDVSLPEVDISLPEEKVEVKEPEMEIEAPEIQVEVKDTVGSPSRFKMPTLKFPQFGAAAPNITVEVPDVDKDIKVHGSEIPEPRLTMSAINIEKPSVDLKGPSIDLDVKSKRLDIVTLPEASVEVQRPSIELKVPSGKGEIPEGLATEIDVKMKKPRMSFGWFSKSEVKAPEVDVSLPKGDISLPEVKVEVKESEVEIKAPEIQVEMKHGIELEGQGSKFKLPKFGISLPKVKGPEFDLSISKTDVDVNLPERRADQLPDVEVGVPSVEVEIPEAVSKDIDVKMKKPRMSFPKFGFSKPEVKVPEVDVSLPEVDISLPEEKVEVKEPEMEIEAPEIQVEVKDTVGSPSRFKMPTLKFPQFGAAAPNITVEVPDVDKDIKVHGSEIPEPRLTMSAINIEKPSVDLKGPSIDLDVKSKRLDIVTLPEASVEVQLPSIELKVPSGKGEIPEGVATEIDVKMKKPRMTFGWFSKSEVKPPEVDVSLPKGNISLPEVKVEVKESEVEIKAPEIQVEMKHGIEFEGQGSKFKLPKFGISLPKVKGPEFDLSISKTDVDVNLPERRADLQLPDVEVGVPSVEVEIPEAVSKDIDVKMKKPRMSFPKFGFSKPEVKAPEVDVSLPEVDISLPEEKVEVKEPEVEIEAPEIQAEVKDTVGSSSRFKMPTLKFPQFGAAAPNITVEVPDVDKDIKVHGSEIPETKLTMSAINIEKPSVDLKGPSIDVDVKSKTLEIVTLPEASVDGQPPRIELKVSSGEVEMPEGDATEIDVKMKKPRMSFGWFSKPEVKSPEVNVSLPKADISLPGGKVEVKEPAVEIKAPELQVEMKHGIELQGQGSKFKLPKFGILLPKVKGPEIGLSISKTDVDVDLPERRAALQLPDVEVGVPSVEVEIPEAVSKDIDVKMKKPRMSFPKFGFSKPEVKAPEVDVSLPKVDMSLPEGKVEVKVPEVEIEAPEIQVEIKHDVEHEGQGRIFKLPTFGMSLPKGKDPEMDLSVSKKVIEVTLPEASVEVQPPSVELKVPSGEIEMPDGAATGIDVKMKIPQMSFGWFSKPEVKPPEVDVSLPKVDISLPEGNVEVKEPEVEMNAPESQVEMKYEGLSVDGKLETSEMGFKMATFKFPKSGATSKVVVDVSDKEKYIKVPGVEIIDQLLGASLQIDLPEHRDTVDIKGSREVQLHDAGSKRPSVKGGMAIAEVDVHEVEVSKLTIDDKGHGSPSKGQGSPSKGQDSPSKFKLPTFKMPRLSISKSKPENEHDDINPNVILENYEIPVKPQGPEKSPKLTLTTFGEVLRSIDVEFDVPKLEEVEEKLTGSKEDITASGKTELNAQTSVETQSVHKEEEAKEKSKFGWFKFPTFGLSSPSESAKILEKDTSEKEVSEKSPDSVEQDVSLTFSVHSSDTFADISSTVTSEQFGPSLASPTKVTVKYSDPIATEVQGDVITSTARTQLIAFEPYLAEKVTIPMSSGVSSSSVDTLKLESGTHVSTSNIQAIPDTQKATLLTDLGLQTGTAGVSFASWSVDDTNKTQSDGQTLIERHVVREMSGTDRETVFITQKVTHVFGAEPISDETASSIKQMKDTTQSEKNDIF
ncbi:neuroblast differentiation-associated protein AHNAK-like [Salmo trutta]|uniref:neuroblast differentiation-associated protein AHNAK-like n=1 Tax=Salmo trutta TaxID=8032 RepID=UPI00113049F4|nr:neuroblast differentiation-associated protein AHNAK-like [Salmo trutta]